MSYGGFMMKVVVAIDSFKGCLSSEEVGEAAKVGILRADSMAEVDVCPVADGGEGTADALVNGMKGKWHSVKVTDPLGRRMTARYGIAGSDKTAVMEMSAAAGLTLLYKNERNPLSTTTYGVGEMIRDAINKGCRSFIIGIGGSATNDAGAGMLQALGFDLLDEDGKQVTYGARGAGLVREILRDGSMSELKDCIFRIACDVRNPLCGENGASRIYGPQKGADKEAVEFMDSCLKKFSVIAKKLFPDADPDYPGAGAAGGLGFAFRTFLGGSLEPGIDIVMEATGLEERICDADIVITGEGRLDSQTAMGKTPIGVARLSKRYGKPVLALAGSIGDGAEACIKEGIDAFFPIAREPMSLSEAMNPDNAKRNIAAMSEQVFRLYAINWLN